MGNSGIIYGSFSGRSTNEARPYILWEVVNQSVSGNWSDVEVKVVYERYVSYLQSYNLYGPSLTLNTGGQIHTSGYSFDLRPTTKYTLLTRTIRINHDANGKKSITISFSQNTNVSLGTAFASGTAVLNDIPRASIRAKVSGSCRTSQALYAKAGGSWRQAKELYAKAGEVWRQCV